MSFEKIFFIVVGVYFVTALPMLFWYGYYLEPSCYELCNQQGYEIVLSASSLGKECLECTCFYREKVQVDEVVRACGRGQEG